jgi:hypothetical protein
MLKRVLFFVRTGQFERFCEKLLKVVNAFKNVAQKISIDAVKGW